MHMSGLPWDKKKQGNLEVIFGKSFEAEPPKEPAEQEIKAGSRVEYALSYAALGWPVFPLHSAPGGVCSCGNPSCSSPGKHPKTKNGLHDASTDRAIIIAWFERWPDANIAIVTGEKSGVWALDVDAKSGGLESFGDLIDRHGPLPDTPMAITGGGGQHHLFQYVDGIRNRTGVAPGIDVRGEGGYIAVEPSVHASGNAYAWEASSDPTDGVAVAEAPPWLLDLVIADKPKAERPANGGTIAEGGRNNALTSIAGTMRRDGMSQDAIEAALHVENAKRCAPPLPSDEVARIAWSIARKDPAQDYGELAQVDTSALVQSLQEAARPEPLSFLRASDWAGEAPVDREWLVPDWMPMRQTTALYAKGGTGKTLAAQQLLTAVASGCQWFGLDVRRGPAVGVFCEDDADELHRRQSAINAAAGLSWEDVEDLYILPRVGHDNLLMTFDGSGKGVLTQFWRDLFEEIEAIKPAVVVIDTVADTFGGNENIRPQVRQYVQHALTQIATRLRCAVIACAHPSLSGINSGEGTGGSTAWENSVRSRLYMNRDDSTTEITLTRKKSNYSATGDAIRLFWSDGVLRTHADTSELFSSIEQRIDFTFFKLLDHVTDRQQQNVSASKNGNYAPRIFTNLCKQLKITPAWSMDQFEASMNRLLDDGRLVSERSGNGTTCLKRPVDNLGLSCG